MADTNATQDGKKNFVEEHKYTSIGLSLGISFGVAFGSAFDNVAIGISMGMIIGMIIGAQMDQRKRKNVKDSD